MSAVLMESKDAERVPIPEVQAREALSSHGVPSAVLAEIEQSPHCSFWLVLQELTQLRERGYTWSSIIHFQLADCVGTSTRGMRPIDHRIYGRAV